MNNYELTVIVRNNEAVETNKQAVKEILAKHGAVITEENHWGLRRLAYLIDGEKQAFYMFMNVDCPPAEVVKVVAEFKLNPDILRPLFVRIEKRPHKEPVWQLT